MTVSHSVLLRMGNVSDKSSRENDNTHFISNKSHPPKHGLYEIMWENLGDPDRPQMTI